MKKTTWIFIVLILIGIVGIYVSKFSSRNYSVSNLGVASVSCNNLTGYGGLTSTIDVTIENNGASNSFVVEIRCFDKDGELIKEKSKNMDVDGNSSETKTVSVPGRTRDCKCKILN